MNRTAHRAGTPLVAVAVVLLALYAPSAARAGDLLGGRLDTSGTWVAVISKATIPTHVELSTEGDIQLAEVSFDMAPGERRQVAYTGSGLGYVTATMTPLEVAEGSSSGAIELRAWLRYVAPPPAPTWPLLLLIAALLILAGVSTLAYLWRTHAPRQRTRPSAR